MLELLDLICADTTEYNSAEFDAKKMRWKAQGRKGAHVQVSCPLHDSHTVSGYGFILLEDCEGTLGSAEQHVVRICEDGTNWEKLTNLELFSVSNRLSRQPVLLESIQISEIILRSKNLDTWLHILQNCNEVRGLREVGVYDDIGTKGWEYLAKALRVHRPYYLQFRSNINLMIHARSEDLRIIWDDMLEGSKFVVFTINRGWAKQEFLKGSEDAENERNWTELLKGLQGTGEEEKPHAAKNSGL